MTDPWTDDPQVQADPALEAFLHDLSAHTDRSIDPATRTSTLEAMLVTAAETTPTRTVRSGGGRRLRRVLGLTGVKLALAAGVAAATTTGGLAATGSLPPPVQGFAHDLGQQFGFGVPDAPGQQDESDGDPDTTGRDHAPGQQDELDHDPDTTGRDHVPGQQRGEDAPGRSGRDAPREREDDAADRDDAPGGADDAGRRDDDAERRDDTGESNRVEPDRAPPADDVPEDAGRPDQAPDQAPDRSQGDEQAVHPPLPPGKNPPAEATNEPTPGSVQLPGPPDSLPAQRRPDHVPDAAGVAGGAADRDR